MNKKVSNNLFVSKPIKISLNNKIYVVRIKETRRGVNLVGRGYIESPCKVYKRFKSGLTIVSSDRFPDVFISYYNNVHDNFNHKKGRILNAVYPFRDGSVIVKFSMLQEQNYKYGDYSDTFYKCITKDGEEFFIDKEELLKKFKNESYNVKHIKLPQTDYIVDVRPVSLFMDFKSYPINFGTNENIVNKCIIENMNGIFLEAENKAKETCTLIKRFPNGFTIAKSKSGALFYYTNNIEQEMNGFGNTFMFFDMPSENECLLLNADPITQKMSLVYIDENGEARDVTQKESEEIYEKATAKKSFDIKYDKYAKHINDDVDFSSSESEPIC